MPTKPQSKLDKSQEMPGPFSYSAMNGIQYCIGKTAESKKRCVNLAMSEEEVEMGNVCVEVHKDPPQLEVTYTSSGNWTLTQTDFWFDNQIAAMPAQKVGYPLVDKFPYFWCNSSGEVSWGTKFPFNATKHCANSGSYELSAVAHSIMEKRFENGTLDKSTKQHSFGYNMTSGDSTKFFSWFNFSIDCGCDKHSEASPVTKRPLKTLPELGCPDQTMSAPTACYKLRTKDSTVGSLCMELHSSPSILEVKYESSENYALRNTAFWFGTNPSVLKTKANGLPDTADFTYFWRNSTGEKEWTTKIPMSPSVTCNKTEDLQIAMIAQAQVMKQFSNGTIDLSSLVEVFAYDEGESDLNLGSGVFSYPLQCQCGTEEKSADSLEPLPLPGTPNCPYRIASTEKNCYSISARSGETRGSVCLEVLDNPLVVELTSEASEDWVLLSNEFWVGNDIDYVPRRKSGVPDVSRFPYFGGNSSGVSSWSGDGFLDESYSCKQFDEYTLYVVSHLTFIKKLANGTLIHDSKESFFISDPDMETNRGKFGWIPLKISCTCTDEQPESNQYQSPFARLQPTVRHAPYPIVKHQEYCIHGKDGTGRECHAMKVGNSETAGSLCVETVKGSDRFEFTFTSAKDYTLISSEFWLGDSIADVPTFESGETNSRAFPYFFRNSTGEDTWKAQVSLNVSFDCDLIEEYKLAVVASSTYSTVREDGAVIEDTEVSASIKERLDENTGIGWFDLALRCDCKSLLVQQIADSLFGSDSNLDSTAVVVATCETSKVFIDEDFEADDAAEKWENGVVHKDRTFTHFLGRLGSNYIPTVSRSFKVPSASDGTSASSVAIEFVLYAIDEWKRGDSVVILIGDKELDLGNLASGSSDDSEVAGSRGDISWSRNVIFQGSNLGFGQANDEKHLVQLTVPADHFAADGTFLFGVVVTLNEDAENSAGIDDLTMEAHYNCPEKDSRSRLLIGRSIDDIALAGNASDSRPLVASSPNSSIKEAKSRTSTAASAVDGGDSSYCTSDDFPCSKIQYEKDVYVCHYSRSRGYQTLCIPESESNILSYYPRDYCGPCVGGGSSSDGGGMGSLSGLMNWS